MMATVKWKEIPHGRRKQALSLDDTLWFGKYKDDAIRKIIKIDADYLDWCIDNKIFELDDVAELKLAHADRKSDDINVYGYNGDEDYGDGDYYY